MMHKLHLAGQKESLIGGASHGRTTSTRELTADEAKSLIQYLKSQDPEEQRAEVMRRKIISLAREMHWMAGGKADMQRIDAWMVKSSYLHKKINQYRYAELPALVTQFEKVYLSFLKGI
ncbi:MAG: hypothetical protein JST88_09225 [Bacteroidetes bacterium]|nr:hypothetical protein [Bacteroidota bacterium]